MVEVYLDGVFGREYRKFESAVPVGIGPRRRRGGPGRTPERGFRAGEGGESGVIENSLRRRGWAPVPVPPGLGGAAGERGESGVSRVVYV